MAKISAVFVEVDEDSEFGEFEGSYLDKANEKKSFKVRSMHRCHLHIGSKYPIPVSVPLDDDAKPLAPGFYDIDPLSFFEVGQRGRLGLGRGWDLTLRPASASRT